MQSDATISYVLGYAKENVTIGDTQLQSPYNTYVSKGLPPGPIANPGKKALDAVLHSENTDYLYFVADKEGHNHFSKSYEEHLAEVNKIYGADTVKNSSANTEVAAQAGPNYDVAVATTEPNYNYSSAEAVEADSQYVDVEPSWCVFINTHQLQFQRLRSQILYQVQHKINHRRKLRQLLHPMEIIQIPIRMYQRRHLYLNRCRTLFLMHNKYHKFR